VWCSSWDFIISNSWEFDSKIDEKFLAGSWLIGGDSFSENHHSLELSIISIVRFVMDSLKIQIGTSLVYVTSIINYCQLQERSF